MIALVHAWWVVMLRGIAAVTIALIVLLQSHVSMTMVAVAFAAYIFADSVICLLGVLVTGFCVCGALLLTGGLVGIAVTVVSLSDTRAAPQNIHAAQIPMMIWAFVIGAVEVYSGIRFGLEMPMFQRSQFRDHQLARYSLPPERAYLLAGVVAVVFAIALLALPMTSAGMAVPIIGLFAVAVGYLHIRGGLTLGTMRFDLFSPSS